MAEEVAAKIRPGMVDNLASVNDLVVAPYRFGREVPIAKFRAWALERLREVIELASGLWRAGSDRPPPAASIFLFNQLRTLLQEDVGGGWLEHDCSPQSSVVRPGTMFSLSDVAAIELWRASEPYRVMAAKNCVC